MNFSDILNQYMEELDCTSKYLSEQSGISLTKISRFRNGLSAPTTNMDIVAKLAKVFEEMAAEKNITTMTGGKIYENLLSALDGKFDYVTFRNKLNLLIDVLGINISKLASYCNYNPSTISKVRLGRRDPRDPLYMAKSVSDFIARYYRGATDRRKIAEITEKDESIFSTLSQYKKELFEWLSGSDGESAAMKRFLGQTDVFDMDEFLRAKKFGKIHIPTLPVRLPTKKEYTGIKGLEEGIEAFLRATLLSKSTRDVIIYNDHPIDHCIDNPNFVEQWIHGIAGMVLKGTRINIIHDFDRPFQEMMLGLEAFIPLQMTGLVFPYYLDDSKSCYNHLMMVSGIASLSGDSIKGYPDSGRYNFIKANSDIAKDRVRAEQLLSCAKPLVENYLSDRRDEFKEFIEHDLRDVQIIKSILTVPPIFTIGEDLLMRIFSHNNVSEDEAEEIRSYINIYRKRMEAFLEKGVCDQSIPSYMKQELKKHPIVLSLSGIFFEKDIYYSYEEYMEHVKQTQEFAAKYDNFIFNEGRKEDFRNIQIHIFDDKCVVVSKGKAPAIHIVSKHPRIIEACSNMAMVITEEE